MQVKSIKGVRDIFGVTVETLRFIETVCRNVAVSYGFKEIILPTFEDMNLYIRSIGGTTDIVEKQMYEFVDKKGRHLVLRPEGTAGMVRAYIEHNLKDKYPLKRFFYFGPMYRYEKPQKGRYREFYQFGLEIFSEPSPVSDVLLIKIVSEILSYLKVKFVLHINTIGCDNCKDVYKEKLVSYLTNKKNFLCNDCQHRLEKNPFRILDCKVDNKTLSSFQELPKMKDILCDNCKSKYDEVKLLLDKENLEYIENNFLVRGLDYYTGFVFEFKSQELDSSQDTICAGGRYDNLVKEIGGEDTLACGCAFGIDRMIEIVTEKEILKEKSIKKIGIAVVNDTYLDKSLEVLSFLRNAFPSYILLGPLSKKSLKSQLRILNDEECTHVIIVGEEVNNQELVLKDFVNKRQENVKFSCLIERLK